ncbi:uncharacterized protein LOC108741666 [Agrilus planipennis]|uniref:Uncharacterized protein LOC108741666 n=1 Tax=Agrilus planipennis TaxID=224129 RepID=A0A7F5RAT6_AGRPL|nr:uncharacterized protein LOC108741666 [Agrilus planipennis]
MDQTSINPKIIPLEKPQKLTKEAANEILNKLINFPNEAHILEEVVNKFYGQEDVYIAKVILRKLNEDIYDQPDTKYTPPAPLLTPIQRTLLGLMMALEKRNVKVCEKFLIKAEAKLLVEKKLSQISPVLRIYLTICKLRRDKERMRRMCCDAVYFMGDLAVPFLFIVLTSWTEIIPVASQSENVPIVKTLLKVVMSKNCNKPGYNFANLKSLITQYYKYKELGTDDNVFEDLFNKYKEVPSWSLQYEILLLCKYSDKSWVMKKLKNTVIPFISAVTQAPLLLAIFSLVQKICQLFTEDCDTEYVQKVKDWISSLQKGIRATSSTEN